MTSLAERTDVPPTDASAGLPATRRAWQANAKASGTALLVLVAILGASSLMSGCESCDKSPSPASDAGTKDVAGDHSGTDGVVVSCDKVAAASKLPSATCTCDKECDSGHCADGVCCDSACDGKCMACNLPSSLGLCSKVPAGAKPTDAAECKMEDPSTCGQDGTCDGNGGCRQWVKETSCQSGTCDGDGVSAGRVCDGKGTCIAGRAEACFPYTCDPTTNKCEASCTTHCASGQQCVNNSCGQKLNGARCQTADECSTGFCADHVCCNVACTGTCQACDQTGSVGRCQLIAPGLPDPDLCKAEDKNSCGTTGLCDEIGACARFPANITACSEASCVGETLLSSARSCDGQGTCRDAQPIDCSPFKCAAGACNKSCIGDTDCAAGHPCVSVAGSSTKQCSGLKMNGLACAAAAECASASCVDGVCCESSCGGACRSCALPGSLGRCMPVAAAAPDPRSICSDTGQTSCGTNGKCDGTGACQKYPVGFTCGDESCSGGAYTPAPTCNNQSQCVSSPGRPCAPFVCGGTRCLSVCTKDLDCVQGQGQVCLNGSCGLKPNGAYCGKATDCQSNHCAQGVCCNATCNGPCVACNQAGSPGICTAVKDGSADPQAICQITSQMSCGTTGMCQGGGCAMWPSGAKCKDGSCSSINSVTPTSTCNGSGACKTPIDLPCDKFMCTAGACKTSCTTATSATDCFPPNTCVNGSCGLKADGQPCALPGECTHGFCTEGVCCNSACSDAAGTTGLCRSCKVTGSVGTCAAVASGSTDPKNRCTASSSASGDCSNDGTCNGAGACRPWSTSAGCRMQSCMGSTLTASANCDGAGSCMSAQTSTCGNYVCNPTSPSCLTTCTKDADCTMGLTCRKVDNKCGTTLSNGEQCGANGDCTSHICSGESVCCDATCTDGCKSCLVAGKLGMCSGIPAGSNPRVTTTCPPGAPCGNTGKCNGTGACALAGVSTACSVTMTCMGAMMSGPSSTCDGMGSCAPPAPIACMSGYVCSGSTCATSCTTANAATTCAAGYTCMGGHCILPLPLGFGCDAPSDCASGACVSIGTSSVCCATTCADQTCGTKPLCATNGSACLTHAGEGCTVPASCAAGNHASLGGSSTCTGTGTCTPPASVPCTTGYLCAGGVCATMCTAVGDGACDVSGGYVCNLGNSKCEIPVSGGGGTGG